MIELIQSPKGKALHFAGEMKLSCEKCKEESIITSLNGIQLNDVGKPLNPIELQNIPCPKCGETVNP
jgi:hypothetical protein